MLIRMERRESGCPHWPLPTNKSTNSGEGRVMGEGGLVSVTLGSGGSVMLWAMSCWESLGSAMWTLVWHLPEHRCRPCSPFMCTIFPGGCGQFQEEISPYHKTGTIWGAQQRVYDVSLASKFPRSQSSRASVGFTGQTSPIHGGITGIKRSAANILEPDTTEHLQGSSGVHV